MNMGMFAGRLGRNAELRSTPSGNQVCNFSVAVDVGFGEKKETLWVNCALWGERGWKLVSYLTKGKQVSVAGDVGLRTYTTQAGEHRAEITLNVTRLTLQGGGEQAAAATTATPAAAPAAAPAPATTSSELDFDDDIPF